MRDEESGRASHPWECGREGKLHALLTGIPAGFIATDPQMEAEQERESVRAREAFLVASLRDRESLLQEVHHRVNNNLQVIASLLSLQMRQSGDARVVSALKDCQSRVLAISTIHEQLYQSSDYSAIPSRSYVGKLAQHVFQSIDPPHSRIKLILNVDEFALPVEQAIPCGLILNELMTNAVNHAFPGERKGTVSVGLKKKSASLVELSVSDDGVGTPNGFSILEATTMGMQLIATLVSQLKGTLQHLEEPGTNVQVFFPTLHRSDHE